jgi:hypothetical protein
MIEGKERKDPRTWFYYHGPDEPNNITGYLDPDLKAYRGWEESVSQVLTANGTIDMGGLTSMASLGLAKVRSSPTCYSLICSTSRS